MFKWFRPPSGRLLTLALALSPLAPSAFADSQDLGSLPEITITADRVEEPVGQAGASVTVVPAAEIAKYGNRGVTEVLRSVAGIDVNESGGPGTATEVRLRGALPGEVLVLIDGVRVGDPSSTDGSFDFGNLTAIDIERIEVLRGPQSALYGSDAMGGVINIITKKGTRTPHRSVTVEAGSYGTLSTQGLMSGADDKWSYALGVAFTHSDGFPHYGYRVSPPIPGLPPLPGGDPSEKGGLNGHFTYRLSDDVTIDSNLSAMGNAQQQDNPYAVNPGDVFNRLDHSRAFIANGYVRATIDSFGGLLTSKFTVFGDTTKRDIWSLECQDNSFDIFYCLTGYQGSRYGEEYQGDLKLGAYGGLTLGARRETETADFTQNPVSPDGSYAPISASQTTNAVFGEYRATPLPRLDVTLGGRIDAVENGPRFETWRTTVAYHLDEIGMKLRASAGTGAKVATLYQSLGPYSTPGLQPEQNFGYDIGFDESLWDGRAKLSASYFNQSYRNLIAFAANPLCTAAQLATGYGCYYNVGRAKTDGVELAGEAVVLPDVLRVRGSYTYLQSRDLEAQIPLFREPMNSGTLSLVYDGIAKLEIEPRLQLVGARYDYNYPTNVWLAPYAKLDVLANYKYSDSLTVFARVENLTDARYQEVYNFGTAGRSVYAGLTYAW